MQPRLPAYAELQARSNFSFLTGASHPGELVERAKVLGYSALAVTDECSLAGVVRAHLVAKHVGLPLIIGSELRLHLPFSAPIDGLVPPQVDKPATPREAPPVGELHARLVLLAQTRRGYGNLSHWITVARRRALKGSYLAHPGDVEGKVPEAPMLAGLPDCFALLVPDASQPFTAMLAHALWLKTWFQDRARIAARALHRAGDDELMDNINKVSELTDMPVVATGDVLMHVRSRKPLQDVLTATRLMRPVMQCGRQLESNAEQHLRSRARLASLYPREWLDETVRIAAQCMFSLDELRYEYPDEIVPAGTTPALHLRALTEAGARERYPHGVPDSVKQQIEHELALIRQLEYEPYFLTVADVVRWAREQSILCQGRGSAANSTVCYCLHVTEVDPSRSTLLFERFISAERNEPPDIDIDFEHQRREEVIQHVYRKYGRHRAAMTAVVISYRPRSALRDVGRALGIDVQRIEGVVRGQHWFDGRRIDVERLRENGFDPASPVVQQWMELTQQLIGFPRHLSQHPGGFVIARGRVSEMLPVENATMLDRSVIQWDKDDLDTLRLLKVDLLALGMLSALKRSFALVGQKLGRPFAMQDVPKEDAATYDMICRADTIGVFQIESRAQMSMLPRLQPRRFYDLVIEVAIVRPGPIQGGMVHPYLRRRQGLDPTVYPSDEIKQALERTNGVPIFQEQVMQIAMLAADFTPGEADALRRAMAAWKRKGGLEPFYERLVGRMVQKGYDREFAESIFKQIKGFGEYGFPESHAASFALLAYDSSWIKCHHPDAFLVALLNSQPMGFYAPAQLVRDAREHGVQVLPVDVAISEWDCTLEPSTAMRPASSDVFDAELQPVRLGLNRVSGLSESAAQRLVEARAQRAFDNVEDLARRAQLDDQALKSLAAADALKRIAGHRRQAAWAAAGVDTRPTELLRSTRVHEAPAVLEAPDEAESMRADYRTVGLTLNRHPLAMLRDELAAYRVQPASVLRTYPHGRPARASGLVTHRQRPETANGTIFVTLEDETGAVNVIVWPRVAQAQRRPLLAATLLTVYGQWQREGDVMHLVASRLVDHTDLLHGLTMHSRDFR